MTFDEIEKAISRGEDMPADIDPVDKSCWLSMRGIYRLYRAKLMTRDAARIEKAEVVRNFHHMKALQTRYIAGAAQYQEDIAQAGELAGTLCRAEGRDEALDTALRLITRMLGEGVTEKTVRGRLKL